jgi:phage FluMu gp28-like protein
MVYDWNCYMPGDGSLQQWLDAHQEPKYIHYFCGCDLGRKRDPSTLAIIEVQYTPNGRTYVVSYLKRFTLSMLYTDIAAKLVKTDESLKRIAAKKGKEAIISYVLDATGLGSPICELVEKALPLADIKQVYITGGINTTEGSAYNEYHVPKGQLLSSLMAAFDSKSIYMTRRSKEIDQIVTELAEFEIHITDSGRDIFDDRGKGHHSDLVIALALAVWAADYDGYSGGPMVW